MNSVLRRLTLDDAHDRVVRTMALRRPQRESLDEVHRLMGYLNDDLHRLAAEEVRFCAQEMQPGFNFGAAFPSLEFLLATGVGKTRLMASIIAYLYLSGQSSTFLMLAPRRAILRKLMSEAIPGAEKYLFVDPGLIPDPVLWHQGNLDAFAPSEHRFASGDAPELFIFSPQSFVGGDRRAWRTSEFTGTSLGDYLASKDDLVVLVDEAHHLRGQGVTDARAWTEAVRELNPKLQFGFSATPPEEANLLYSYDLATCLREGLYTKSVRVIVDQQPVGVEIDPVAWDRRTVDFALERLRRKERAIEAGQETARFPKVRPVLLICAENTAHADEIAEWLIEGRSIDPDEILVTHSRKTKTEDELQRLVGIQDPDSRVRIVVNVFELTEGWDVTNVYVIAPLRKMGTFQGAIQTMGRGLRLPAGRRVGDEDLDSLDLLCFGSESLQEILDEALSDFGETEDEDVGIDVRSSDDEDIDPPLAVVPYDVEVVIDASLDITPVSLVVKDVDLATVKVDLTASLSKGAVEFDLSRLERLGSSETLTFGEEQFRHIVVSRVIRGLTFLSDLQDRKTIDDLVRAVLSVGDEPDGTVRIDPNLLAELMKAWIREARGSQDAEYEATGPSMVHAVPPITVAVPANFKKPLKRVAPDEWSQARHVRIPFTGWNKSVHASAAFDSSGEYRIAEVLDASMTVEWWFRNTKDIIRIATPAGGYLPDIVCRTSEQTPRMILIQAKGDHLWEGAHSRARLQARAAEQFCLARNAGDAGARWEHWVILQSDVKNANTLEDLHRLAVSTSADSVSR